MKENTIREVQSHCCCNACFSKHCDTVCVGITYIICRKLYAITCMKLFRGLTPGLATVVSVVQVRISCDWFCKVLALQMSSTNVTKTNQ